MKLYHGPIMGGLLRVVRDGMEPVIEVLKEPPGDPKVEPVVWLTVTSKVAHPRAFHHFLFWRERWYKKSLGVDTTQHFRFYLRPVEEAEPACRRAFKWLSGNLSAAFG